MFKTNKQALKSFFAYSYMDLKKILLIGTYISAGVFLTQLLLSIIMCAGQSGQVNSNGGMLVSALSTFVLTFMIGIFVNTNNSEMRNLYRFPINRTTYAIGNLVYHLVIPIAIMTVVSAFQIVESWSYILLSKVVPGAIYYPSITVQNYLGGMLPTYASILAILSLTHVLSMTFHRFKLPFVIVLVVFFTSLIFSQGLQIWLFRIVSYPFKLQAIIPYTLIMIGFSLVCHVIAYVPTKIMEVKS